MNPFNATERKLMTILLKLPIEVPQFYGNLPQRILEYFETQVIPMRSTTFVVSRLNGKILSRFIILREDWNNLSLEAI